MIRHIVKAKIAGENRKKNLVRETLCDGLFVFRKYKEKKHSCKTIYGPYNTIKQKAVSCSSYNISEHQIIVDLKTVEEVKDITNDKRTMTGFNYT